MFIKKNVFLWDFNWETVTMSLATFKRWDGVNDEKF